MKQDLLKQFATVDLKLVDVSDGVAEYEGSEGNVNIKLTFDLDCLAEKSRELSLFVNASILDLLGFDSEEDIEDYFEYNDNVYFDIEVTQI